MFELITMFLTGGGSAALGSVLKGVFGAINDSRQQKFELELARRQGGMNLHLNFKNNSITVKVVSLLVLLVGCSHSSSSPRSQQSSSSAPSSQVQKSSHSPTLVEKVQQSSSLGSSLFQLSKPLYR